MNFLPEISKINITFTYDNQEYIKFLPFINLEQIILEGPELNLTLLKNSSLKNLINLDLSHTEVTDIKEICGEVPFTKLEILNLSNNTI